MRVAVHTDSDEGAARMRVGERLSPAPARRSWGSHKCPQAISIGTSVSDSAGGTSGGLIYPDRSPGQGVGVEHLSEQAQRPTKTVTQNARIAVEPQPILAPLTSASMFLVLTVADGAEDVVRGLLPDVAGLTRTVGFRAPDGGLTCVVGIGSQLWDRLFAGPRPAELHPFHEIVGPRFTAVSTPGDLLLHIRASRMDLCFELAGLLSERLAGRADVVDEVHGFRYFDQRDLLGFVDGTENPTGIAAVTAVLIGDEQPYFAGGSYVIVQKYLHDLPRWNAVPVEGQERVIGRRKLSDVELPDEVKPPNSHVALNTVLDENGLQRQIVRDNMPFGNIGSGEFGTYFIGYSSSPGVTEQMLTNMFSGRPPAAHDAILDFSTAVTGGLFFVPSADMLDNPPAAAGRRDLAGTGEPVAAGSPADQSLHIGTLKRSSDHG